MDRLFQRYGDPFLFMNGMLQCGRFVEFVEDFVQTTNKEKEDQVNWEFYLHRALVMGSFNDFIAEMETNKKNRNLSKRTIETTVQHSMSILNKFNPEKGG